MGNSASTSGSFSYPSPGSRLQFNDIDSVVASWTTSDSIALDCILGFYYRPNNVPWLSGFNLSVPANGTAIIPMVMSDVYYLGQLNFFYINSKGGSEKFLGSLFDVNPSPPQSRAVTWSQAAPVQPRSSDSALGTGAIVEIVLAIVICAGLAAAVIFYRLRRPKAIEAEIRASSPAPVRPHVPAKLSKRKMAPHKAG